MAGNLTNTGFVASKPVIWRTGWTDLRPLPIPTAARKSRVIATRLNDINSRGDIVGTVYGFDAKDYSRLHRIDPVLWSCSFPR